MRNVLRLLLLSFLMLSLTSCNLSCILNNLFIPGWNCKNDDDDPPPPPPPPEEEEEAEAELDPLEGAVVEIFAYPDLKTAIHNTTTAGGSFSEIGRFPLPGNLITATKLYLVVVSGGMDHDVADDGVQDEEPTPNNGAVHAVVTGAELLAGGVKVTVLSEVAYQQLLAQPSEVSEEGIREELDIIAGGLLNADLNDDGVIDAKDLAAFDPVADQEALVHGFEPYQAIISDIHAGEDPGPAAQALN